jgi:hypothetical protein
MVTDNRFDFTGHGDQDAPGSPRAATLAPPAHQGFPPPNTPTEPVADAPARFGIAGISAGEEARYKTTIPDHPRWTREPVPDMLAKGLGWFSIALGTLEVVNPGGLARWLGMEDKAGLIRIYGVREIGTGIAILMQDNPKGHARWVRARVVGDALDLATLAPGLVKGNTGAVVTAIAAVAGVTMLDILCAAATSQR